MSERAENNSLTGGWILFSKEEKNMIWNKILYAVAITSLLLLYGCDFQTPSVTTDAAPKSARQELEKSENLSMQHQLKVLKRWAEVGDSEAMMKLGYIYEKGTFVQPDLGRAIRYWTSASTIGHYNASRKLAFVYERGLTNPYTRDIKPNLELAKFFKDKYITQLQEQSQSDANAAFLLAKESSQKSESVRLLKLAKTLLEKGMSQGDNEAKFIYASLKGSGQHPMIFENEEIVIKLLKELEMQNVIKAKMLLGRIYAGSITDLHQYIKDSEHLTEKQMHEIAVTYFRPLANRNHPTAQRRLARLFNSSPHLDDRDNQAIFWANKVLKQLSVESKGFFFWEFNKIKINANTNMSNAKGLLSVYWHLLESPYSESKGINYSEVTSTLVKSLLMKNEGTPEQRLLAEYYIALKKSGKQQEALQDFSRLKSSISKLSEEVIDSNYRDKFDSVVLGEYLILITKEENPSLYEKVSNELNRL